MYVEEMETNEAGAGLKSGFLIGSTVEFDRIFNGNIRTLVINTAKGADIGPALPSSLAMDAKKLEHDLRARFTSEDLRQASGVIRETVPQIREMFANARMNKVLSIGKVDSAADLIFSIAEDSLAAIVGISRLKQMDRRCHVVRGLTVDG